jgi:cobalt-zinc-cadmium resistance protein CzcA
MTARYSSLTVSLLMTLSLSVGCDVPGDCPEGFPLATVVIGVLVSSTVLAMLVVPAVYPWFDGAEPRRGR